MRVFLSTLLPFLFFSMPLSLEEEKKKDKATVMSKKCTFTDMLSMCIVHAVTKSHQFTKLHTQDSHIEVKKILRATQFCFDCFSKTIKQTILF